MTIHYVIQPGWQNSGPEHWQSHWQSQLTPSSRVAQQDWLQPNLNDWVAAFDAHIRAIDAPIIILAHSLGCLTVAHWAAQHDTAKIDHAFLVAPADVERPNAPAAIQHFAPIPLTTLPFPATVVASDNDPYCELGRAQWFAKHWGASLHILRGAGHINTESGYGEWADGLAMLMQR